jgi:uncharacterized protein YeaO (DUF488 family)
MRSASKVPHVRLKRIYLPASADDGVRVLVDRLWPRGLRKSEAAIDRWIKDIAPSTELRRWFGHDPGKWTEFRQKYLAELADKTGLVDELRSIAQHDTLTLLFAARDELHNEAVVIRDILAGKSPSSRGQHYRI